MARKASILRPKGMQKGRTRQGRVSYTGNRDKESSTNHMQTTLLTQMEYARHPKHQEMRRTRREKHIQAEDLSFLSWLVMRSLKGTMRQGLLACRKLRLTVTHSRSAWVVIEGRK